MGMKIEFDTDNAAFDENRQAQIVLILGVVAGRVYRGDVEGLVRDANGNAIGSWSLDDQKIGT